MSMSNWQTLRSFSQDKSVSKQRVKPGAVRRIVGYAKPFKLQLIVFLVLIALSAAIGVVTPLLLKAIIDHGIVPRRVDIIIWLAVAVAGVAVATAVIGLAQRWYSARVGEGLIYQLRTEVFDHVQAMPLAFFTRAQTGALVSRLNSDVIGAQQALTSTLSGVLSNVLGVVLTLVTMFALSWKITLIALVLLPIFVLPARWLGRKMQTVVRSQMELDAEMSSMMTERFNVSGAMLAKLYGDPNRESTEFSSRAAKVRDMGVIQSMYARVFITALTLVAAIATAVVYGLGGVLVINGLPLGTLVALAALLSGLYGPLTALSNVQVDVMTTLVSFDRVFELLDLKPMITDDPDAHDIAAGELELSFDNVGFSYPDASQVSLASLESISTRRRGGGSVAVQSFTGSTEPVLTDVSFSVEPGTMVALVGPSGAGKTTITHLAARLYDPTSGAVRINGEDLRTLRSPSLHDRLAVVSQDAHLFHDTLRANLVYAKDDATDEQIMAALAQAHIEDVVSRMPDGLDTVVGDRGYRLSGGEKQRIAIARLLLKAPSIVVLDEATAHLDSESERLVQQALSKALAGRTSLVIAHRLSTIRDADQILVVEDGGILERGTHTELLAAGGTYAELYRTQFAQQAESAGSLELTKQPARRGQVEPV